MKDLRKNPYAVEFPPMPAKAKERKVKKNIFLFQCNLHHLDRDSIVAQWLREHL